MAEAKKPEPQAGAAKLIDNPTPQRSRLLQLITFHKASPSHCILLYTFTSKITNL